MMTTIPFMATVSDLQRGYRVLVDRIKKTGEPLIVVNNSGVERIREMEEKYLLKIGEEALEEYRLSKTIRLKKGQKLSDLL